MAKEKNWLIRTTNFQILGPVSKEKILEFVEKGSLKAEDEITSGNGYWFQVREKDLLDKYVFGDIPQTFNPISEAPNVLTVNLSPENTGTHNKITSTPKREGDLEGEGALPQADDLEYPDMNLPAETDLEYPDMGELSGTSQPSGELNIEALEITPEKKTHNEAAELSLDPMDEVEGILPSPEDLEYPDMGEFEEVTSPTNPSISDFDEETDPSIEPMNTSPSPPPIEKLSPELPPSKKIPKTSPTSTDKSGKKPVVRKKVTKVKRTVKKKQRNDKLFFILTSIFFVVFLLVSVIFYYKKVINKPLPFIGEAVIKSIISPVNAQTLPGESLVKKKVFLT